MLDANLQYLFGTLWGLGTLARIYLVGSALVIFGLFYIMVVDALYEVSASILQLWDASNPLSRLILIGLAIYTVRRLSPYVRMLHRKGIL